MRESSSPRYEGLRVVSGGNQGSRRVSERRHDELAPLAQSARSGDTRATRTLLIALGPHLVKAVRSVLGSSHPDVEDVAQEAAFAVMGALTRFRGESTVLHFACRVAVLTAMNARRRDSAACRATPELSDSELDIYPSSQPGPELGVLAVKSRAAVRDLVACLPEAQAEALALHCVLGYTVEEIAASAAVPVETIRSRLRLARKALRERLLGDATLRELLEGEG